MSNFAKCLLVFVIVASVTCSTYAIHCYRCESYRDAKCGQNFEAEDAFKYDCAYLAPPRYLQPYLPTQNATGCMKTTIEGINGQPQISRKCYFGDVSNTQTGCRVDPSLPSVKLLACEVCTGDLCNSSTVTGPVGVIAMSIFYALARLLS